MLDCADATVVCAEGDRNGDPLGATTPIINTGRTDFRTPIERDLSQIITPIGGFVDSANNGIYALPEGRDGAVGNAYLDMNTLKYDTATGVLVYTPPPGFHGNALFIVAVTVDNGEFLRAEFLVTVNPPSPLVLPTVDNQNFAAGETVNLTLPAARSGEAPFVYALTANGGAVCDIDDATAVSARAEIAGGLMADCNTRVINGALTAGATINLAWQVTDGNSATAASQFTITTPSNTTTDNTTTDESTFARVAMSVVGGAMQSVGKRIAGRVNNSLAGNDSANGSIVDSFMSKINSYASSNEVNWKKLLGDVEFNLPVDNASALNFNSTGKGTSRVSFWAGSDYQNINGESELAAGELDYDGELFGLHFGMDSPLANVGNNAVGGAAISVVDGELDYQNPDGEGEYELSITSVHPYVGWQSGAINWHAMIGYGEGDWEIIPDGGTSSTNDLALQTMGIGGLGLLRRVHSIDLHIKADLSYGRLEVDGDDNASTMQIDTHRMRVLLHGVREVELQQGKRQDKRLSQVFEIGGRYDGGDGDNVGSLEVGGGLDYRSGRLTVNADARMLLGRDEHNEWGVNAVLRYASGLDGQGLLLALSPGYGDAKSGMDKLWEGNNLSNALAADDHNRNGNDHSLRWQTKVGYGINSYGYGLFTPYGEIISGGVASDAHRYRVGLHWRGDVNRVGGFNMAIVNESHGDAQSVVLNGNLTF